MICVYDKKTLKQDLNNNGLCVLDECILAEIDHNLNGEYSLAIEYPATSHKSKYLEEYNIIKANNQLFRIYKVERNQLEILTIKLWARHIFYDMSFYFIESAKILNANALEALEMTIPPELQAIYNISAEEKNIAPFAVKEINAVDAMFKILEVYGGELLRDNFNIDILDKVGSENGISIKYGKNIKGLTVIEDTSELCTRVYAVGENDLLLPERYIEGESSIKAPFPITKKVEFRECKDVESLRAKAKEYIQKASLPKVHISVDFLELSKTQEYKHFEKLTEVNLGDVVDVTHERLGVTTKLRAIRKKIDLINPINTKVELGDPLATIIEKMDISKLLEEINKTIAGSLSSVIIKKNSDTITINTSRYQAMVIGFTTKADTNLNCNITMTGKASEDCTINILFSLDGVYFDFKPVQKLATGDNVIGFSLPMPQVIVGDHTFIVEIWVTNGTFVIEKNNLQITIEGRDLEGGLSANLPRAEIIVSFLYLLFLRNIDKYKHDMGCDLVLPESYISFFRQSISYESFRQKLKGFYADAGIREVFMTVMGIVESFSRENSGHYNYDDEWINWDSGYDIRPDGIYEHYHRATIVEPILITNMKFDEELGTGVLFKGELPSRDYYNKIINTSIKFINKGGS